jgi:ABC-type polysaccharide/polyol phosphate export permease
MWQGDYSFLIRQLVVKDFRIRYRNMSLGVFWSLLNPLIMVALFSFLFTKIFQSNIPHYALYILVGLIPYNFFAAAWLGATTSLIDNAGLVKKVPVPREIIPITTVLSNLIHLGIQFLLIVGAVLYYGLSINGHWLWLIVIWGLELIFLFGISLATSSLNLIIRDTRYVVESINLVLFWLVPIFYSFDMIPVDYKEVYQYNPVAALVLASRRVILDAQAPPLALMLKLTLVAGVSLIAGATIFRHLKPRFHRYI